MSCKMPWWAGSENPPPDKDKIISDLRAEVASLKEERDELAEFKSAALVGFNVAEGRIESLTQQLAAANAKIDALMLEYCPDEMTPEQVDNWAKHQQVVQVCPECDIAGCRHLRAALSNLNEDGENRG